jgi:flagellar FliL protein
MPDKKSDDEKSSEKSKSGGSKKIIISGVICVALIAAGLAMSREFLATAPPVAEGAGAADDEVKPEHVVGSVVALDPININLAGGRYLRIAVALGLDAHVELVDSHGKAVELRTAPASDIVLSTFSGMEMMELATIEGREKAKQHLEESLVPFYGEDVVAVYFTEFVMQ